jgi:hypothetical protein
MATGRFMTEFFTTEASSCSIMEVDAVAGEAATSEFVDNLRG